MDMNDFFRQIRRVRDKVKDWAEEQIEVHVKRELKAYWAKQPWYRQLLKPLIMREAYRFYKQL